MKALVKTMICPIHTTCDVHSELADEVLCGMTVDIRERCNSWCKIVTHYRYEGWVQDSALLAGDTPAEKWAEMPKKVVLYKNTCDILAEPKVQSWPLITLTRGALVSPVGEAENGWQKVALCDGRQGYTRGSFLGEYYESPPFEDEDRLRQLILENARRYEGTHYRWGGKTPIGIDCSGLASMAYLLSGILIHRDAHMQEGFPIHEITLEQAKPADLLFFPGHVAIYTGDGQYIHATGAAGSDGYTHNSLNPEDPDFRADLKEKLTQVGSYF